MLVAHKFFAEYHGTSNNGSKNFWIDAPELSLDKIGLKRWSGGYSAGVCITVARPKAPVDRIGGNAAPWRAANAATQIGQCQHDCQQTPSFET